MKNGRDIKRIKSPHWPQLLARPELSQLPTHLKSTMVLALLVNNQFNSVLMSEEKVKQTGVKPLARIVSYADAEI